ncbi:unnamed protein product [Lymnaea stagnalis]|uniref:Uncharacterized protein n=1 Tax=Lymnaea stagnalis TaxID=6523 RepID=A0AAV2H1F7_LYMST
MTIYYKFNGITQNLNAAPQDAAMGRPITPQAFSTSLVKAPDVFYDFKTEAKALSATRRVSSQVADLKPGQYLVPNSPNYIKLMERQSLFSANDGKLVWQKLPKDLPMYYAIVGLVTAGVIWSVFCLKKFASPPKNQ